MKHIFCSFLTLLLFVANASAQLQSINVNGQQRQIYVHAPKGLQDNAPLLISCHGMDQDINYQRGMAKWEQVADTANFLVVYPGGGTGFSTWDINGDKDAKFIVAIIDEMAKKYAIDTRRVYMSGFSMGGMLTYNCMNQIPDKIAAFAPVSGHLMGGGSFNSPRPLPLIHVHGTSDSVVSYEQSEQYVKGWAKRNGCSSTPVKTTHNNGNPSCTKEVWTGGECETEVVRISFNGRDHEHNNSGALHTSSEIWNFVKNYSLDCGKIGSSGISFASPSASGKYSDGDVIDFEVKVGGKVDATKIVLTLDGEEYVTLNSDPFKAEWNAVSGDHELKAVATMVDGTEMEAKTKFHVNVPQTAYSGTPTILPARIEAEEFDNGGNGYAYSDSDDKNEGDAKFRTEEGVDVVKTADGMAIGYTTAGEWLEYTVEVLQDAEFGIEAMVSNGNGNISIDILSDNKKIATLTGSKTKDWDTYSQVVVKDKVTLTAGKHVIKVLLNSDYTNIDYIEFTGEKVEPSNIAEANANIEATIAPNPAKDAISVITSSPIVSVNITSMSGALLLSSSEANIDVTSLSAGCYMVTIVTDKATVVKKLMIEK